MPKGLKRGGIPCGSKIMWKCPCCDMEKEYQHKNVRLMNKMMKLHMEKNHPDVCFEIHNSEMPKGIDNDITNGKVNGAGHQDMDFERKLMMEYNHKMLERNGLLDK